jgi:hypothetical protein
VTQAAQWPKRRAEIVEDFEREIYGRVPANVPKVTWEVTATTPGQSGGVATVTKTVIGHVDSSAYPELAVNIEASFTVPADTRAPVPMMLVFSPLGAAGRRAGSAAAPRRARHGPSRRSRTAGATARSTPPASSPTTTSCGPASSA